MPIAWFNSAECQSPLVVVVVAVVRVGCGGDRTPPRLVMRTARTDQLLVLAESVLTGVVTAAGDAQNLSTLLALHQREVWVPTLVIFSIPIPSWSALRPPEPWISIFHRGQANSLNTDIVILTLTNINTVILIHVTIHRDVPTTSVLNLRQLSVCHQVLGCPDQVISVTALHDSMTREQVQRVPGARIEEQSPTTEAGNVGLGGGKTIHSSSKLSL